MRWGVSAHVVINDPGNDSFTIRQLPSFQVTAISEKNAKDMAYAIIMTAYDEVYTEYPVTAHISVVRL